MALFAKIVNGFNPYSPSVTFLYPLKTPENLRFSDVFRGYRNVTLGENEFIEKFNLTEIENNGQ